MRAKAATRGTKTILSDTSWKSGEIPPRHAPIYSKSKPLNSRWRWRSVKLIADDDSEFVLLIQISPDYGKWMAWLMTAGSTGTASIIMRIEDQCGGNPGLHVHAHCNAEPPAGPKSINAPDRLPNHNQKCRRSGTAWTQVTFVTALGRMLHVTFPEMRQGELF